MTRSRKKNNIHGVTTCRSEKSDKRIANRKLRRRVKTIVSNMEDKADKTKRGREMKKHQKETKWVSAKQSNPLCISDADYIRQIKIKHGGDPAIETHNERLEQIAKKLEGE